MNTFSLSGRIVNVEHHEEAARPWALLRVQFGASALMELGNTELRNEVMVVVPARTLSRVPADILVRGEIVEVVGTFKGTRRATHEGDSLGCRLVAATVFPAAYLEGTLDDEYELAAGA